MYKKTDNYTTNTSVQAFSSHCKRRNLSLTAQLSTVSDNFSFDECMRSWGSGNLVQSVHVLLINAICPALYRRRGNTSAG